jgi:hypothetical protein
MPKVFYVLYPRNGGRNKRNTIPVFRSECPAIDLTEKMGNMEYEVSTAYVPEEVAEVWIVSAAEKRYGISGCATCSKVFYPIVVATEAAAKLVRKPTECCSYSLYTTRCRIHGERAKPKRDTAYVVLTPNPFGLEDDDSVSVFRSLYDAEKHQGEHEKECKIKETSFPDAETEACVVTSKYNYRRDCFYCDGRWFEAAAFVTEQEALVYGNSRKCRKDTGDCEIVLRVTKTAVKEHQRFKKSK